MLDLKEILEEKRVGQKYIIHKSIVPLIFRIVFIAFMTVVFIVFISLIYNYLPNKSGSSVFSYVLFDLFVLLMALFSLSFIIFDWTHEFYIVSNTEITKKRGVIYVSEEVHKFENLDKLSVDQSFWGKLFNYGDINIFLREMPEVKITLFCVQNPSHYLAVIEKIKSFDVPSEIISNSI